MQRQFKPIAIIGMLAALAACDTGRHSAAGFRLPASGDAARGKTEFVALGCSNCHSVEGAELPAPTGRIAVPIKLGGEKTFEMNDGYLVTSIINPSYKIARYSKAQVATSGVSLMPSHAENMTVQQLVDVVAFLQAHYSTRTLPSRYSSYY
jgi:sulfur-oxidizing protein SoxX